MSLLKTKLNIYQVVKGTDRIPDSLKLYFRSLTASLVLMFGILNQAFSEIHFEEVTIKAGINHVGQTWGASWGDYNGDGYPDLWLSNHQSYPSLYRNNHNGTFTDIAGSIFLEQINPNADTHGSMWADIDNDGDQDLLEVSGGGASSIYCALNSTPARNWLNHMYISSEGGLVDQAKQYGLSLGLLRSRTPQFMDFSHDGLLDVIIGAIDADGCTTTALQQKDQQFIDVSSAVELGTNGCFFLTLADLSNSGLPYVICKMWRTLPSYVYDVSANPFSRISNLLPRVSSAVDMAIEDFDGNGELDLLVTRNANTGTFMNNSSALQVTSRQINARFVPVGDENAITFKSDGDIQIVLFKGYPNVMPTDVFIGSDGHHPEDEDPYWVELAFTLSPNDPSVAGRAPRPDEIGNNVFIDYDPASKTWTLAVSNPSSTIWKTNARISGEIGVSDLAMVGFNQPIQGVGNEPAMYLNYGTTFVDYTTHAGLNDADHCESVATGDFDNDMDVDVYLVCYNILSNTANVLYENLQQGVFALVPGAGGAVGSTEGIGETVATADYDQDGCLDLFVANGYWSPPFYNGPHQLFRNSCTSQGNHWLEVDLEGVVSNRDAIGAKVVAKAGGVTQVRMLSGGMHLYSQNHQRIHFGLGQNQRVDQITVYWPNGLVQDIYDVPADQLIRVSEDAHPPVVGRPRYRAGLDDGVYLWKEADENIYHLRVSAPDGDPIEFDIKLISSAPQLTVLPVKLELGDSLHIEDNGFVFVSRVRGGEDGIDFQLPADSDALISVERNGTANPRFLHVGANGVAIPPAGWIKNASSLPVRPRVFPGNELGLFIGKDNDGPGIEARWSGDGNRDLVNHKSNFRVLAMNSLLSVVPVSLEKGDRYSRNDSSVFVAGAVANGWDGLNFSVAPNIEVGFTFEQDGLLPYHHVNHGAVGDLSYPNAYWITGYE